MIGTKDISLDYLNIFIEMGVEVVMDSSNKQILEIESDNVSTELGHSSIQYRGGILKPSIYDNDQ